MSSLVEKNETSRTFYTQKLYSSMVVGQPALQATLVNTSLRPTGYTIGCRVALFKTGLPRQLSGNPIILNDLDSDDAIISTAHSNGFGSKRKPFKTAGFGLFFLLPMVLFWNLFLTPSQITFIASEQYL